MFHENVSRELTNKKDYYIVELNVKQKTETKAMKR